MRFVGTEGAVSFSENAPCESRSHVEALHLSCHLFRSELDLFYAGREFSYSIQWPLEAVEADASRDHLSVANDDDPLVGFADDLLSHHKRVKVLAELVGAVCKDHR